MSKFTDAELDHLEEKIVMGKKVSGTPFISSITGNVDVVKGNVRRVEGDVEDAVWGDVDYVQGNVVREVWGNVGCVFGDVLGNVNGYVQGEVYGYAFRALDNAHVVRGNVGEKEQGK